MKLEFDLGNPSFTWLHCAGLAGLWMTLKQLEIEKVARPEGLNWQLSHRKIILNWQESDKTVLEWLLKESFQINDGLIALRGLDSQTMRKDAQVIVHQGILGTFLQHTSTHKSSGTKTESLSLGEEEKEIQVTYKALQSYAYQDFASNLCDKNGQLLTKPISVAGWLNPGAVVRHVAFSSDTSFEERPENAFVLLFASVACYYYILRSKLRDKRAQYALVVPEITNLEKYAQYRQHHNLIYATYKDFHASGLGDAGLRFLTLEETVKITHTFAVQRCQVLTLGTVAWATQQKTRTDMYVVEASDEVCHNYKVCDNWLKDKDIEGKEGRFVATNFAKELISENLARNQPWYSGISEKVNSNELFKKLFYEREGLYQVIQKVKSDQREKLFVQACHEAIKFTYGQISEQANKRGEVPNFDRETVRIRTGLGRCKNSDTFREFITDFWSRAGKIPTLQEHWEELMDFVMADKNWKKSRDLALLALASYKGKGISNEDNVIDLGI
ncbi:type I-MYXAN CRISPR-associated Cas8a1/Cmx1 [Nostoc sp. CENA67]|uniref:Type I-MYXAN CRISPR-associated Cas8a1/Cmx1 n=1 Tax=Amazonocrinis nigriterrae CENA67 TaxID=2794033 RepID=A0A8J7L7Z2_9NOST|nr:type I-MYXAN CRISPR-associated Cas8a1/Cmx1 [Amazonocrinis nigriterrae]MBH8562645.1 type I-MYXAN CRISPR-associated Cas8a1/Cmx1 [Amazonocrinis nigriterrae CENA67]